MKIPATNLYNEKAIQSIQKWIEDNYDVFSKEEEVPFETEDGDGGKVIRRLFVEKVWDDERRSFVKTGNEWYEFDVCIKYTGSKIFTPGKDPVAKNHEYTPWYRRD